MSIVTNFITVGSKYGITIFRVDLSEKRRYCVKINFMPIPTPLNMDYIVQKILAKEPNHTHCIDLRQLALK